MADEKIDEQTRNAIVVEAVIRGVNRWLELELNSPAALTVEGTPDGDLMLKCEIRSLVGYGRIISGYFPTDAIEQLAIECERSFDEINNAAGLPYDPELRVTEIKKQVVNASVFLFLAWSARQMKAAKGSFDFALNQARALMLHHAVKTRNMPDVDGPSHQRSFVERAVRDAATEEKKLLAGLFNVLSDGTVVVPVNRGRPSGWTKTKLEAAALKAAQKVARTKKVTLGNVAAVLRRRYPRTGPATGEALRKMMKHYGIEWKNIKAEINNR